MIRTLHNFFVTSYGRTATYWLTALLNAHPEIYCTHGPTLERLMEGAAEPPMEHTAKVMREQDAFYRMKLQDVASEMNRR